MRFPNAYKGVKRIYRAQIFMLLAALLTVAAGVVGALGVSVDSAGNAAASTSAVIGFLISGGAAGIVTIVAFILNLSGICNALKDEGKFKGALAFLLIGIVASIAEVVFQPDRELIASAAQVVSNLCEFLTTVFVIMGVIALADKMSRSSVKARGTKTLRIIIISYVLIIILGAAGIALLLFHIDMTGGIAIAVSIATLLSAVFSVIAYIMYLKLLSRTKRMLKHSH